MEQPKLHKDGKPTAVAIVVVAAVVAMSLLCALVLPYIGKIPPWFMGGW